MRALPILLALLVAVPPASALGALGASPGAASDLIVGYSEGALEQVRALLVAQGARVTGENDKLRFLTATVANDTLLATLKLSSIVEYVEVNSRTVAAGAQWNGAQWNGAQWNGAQWNGGQWNSNSTNLSDPGRQDQWGLDAIRAPAAWATTTGDRRATVCVLDSGIAWDHPDLAANMWTGSDGKHGVNFVDASKSAYDDAGHGTHVAGIAAAVHGNGLGGSGVANVSLMAAKVLDASGRGREADLVAGLVWCADQGADVALMALEVDQEDGPTVKNALRYASQRDVLLVASAGNHGACTDCVVYPARDAQVLAVSAWGKDGKLAGFSSQGPQVDLAAPGVDIASTFVGNAYAYGSGTSQAAAHVAGVAALLRDARPGMSANEASEKLRATARDVGASGHDPKSGAGYVDAGAAIGGG